MGILYGRLSGFFESSIILGLYLIILMFLFALFRGDKHKFYTAVIFESIAGATLLVLFSSVFSLIYCMWIPIFVGLILLTMTSGKKGALCATWIVTGIFLAFSAYDLYALAYSKDYFGIYDWGVYGGVIIEGMFPFVILGLVIAATVVRSLRKKKGILSCATGGKASADETEASVLRDGRYSAARIEKNGVALAGNVLSVISYILTVIGIKIILTIFSTELSPSAFMHIPMIFFAIALICGIIAMGLIKSARAYGYYGSAITFMFYIWAWIMAVILIAIIVAFTVMIIFFMALGSDDSFSAKLNKQKEKVNGEIYEVKDENDERRRLKYSNKDASAYGRCIDDKGDWWETDDGGKSFRKCGLREMKDENGETVFLYDVSGGGMGVFADKMGGLYETKDGGATVSKIVE